MFNITQVTCHLVFGTKGCLPVLAAPSRRDLYQCMWEVMKTYQCRTLRIGGMADHVHLLLNLHPGVSLARLVGSLKVESHYWIEQNHLFPGFEGWQDGYGAFAVAAVQQAHWIDYIRNQEALHRKMTFEVEIRQLVREAGLAFDPQEHL